MFLNLYWNFAMKKFLLTILLSVLIPLFPSFAEDDVIAEEDVSIDYETEITAKKFDTEELLNNLKNSDSNVLLCLSDVLEVLEYIYKKYLDQAKIDNDLEEIFEIGFGYLSNSLVDIKTYYLDYFKKDIILLNRYSTLIVYSILLDDLKGYLLSEERLTEERKATINNASKLIDDVMINLKEIDGDVIVTIEEAFETSLPKKHNYKPVYSVFQMIAEELGIY